MFNLKDTIFDSIGYILETNSAYGHKTFEAYAQSEYGLQIVSMQEAGRVLRQGGRMLANGYGSQVQSLVNAYPNQVFPIWHSTVMGSSFMGEGGIFEAALKDTAEGKTSILLLSDFDYLPKNWIRIKQFIPKEINVSFFRDASGGQTDIVLPPTGNVSKALKNTTKVICDCVCLNVSFSAQKNVMGFNLGVLKKAFGQDSFQTKTLDIVHPLPNTYFRAGKVYVCASVTDTMPYTVLESLLAGVPVLMSPNVGWANVFAEIQHLCVFGAHEIVLAARELSRNEEARESLFYKQIQILANTAKLWYQFNNTLLFKKTKEYKALDLLGLTHIIDDSPKSITYQITTEDSIQNIRQTLSRLVSNGFKVESVDIGLYVNDRYEVQALISVAQAKQDCSDNPLTDLIRQCLLRLGNKDCVSVLVADLITNSLVHISFEHFAQAVEGKTVLLIDRYGWAFHNISKQIVRRKDGCVIISEPIAQALGSLKQSYNVLSTVYFWFPTQQKVNSLFRTKNIAVCVYDHYSYKKHKKLFESVIAESKHIYTANDLIRRELLDSFKVLKTKPIYVLKDGVDCSFFDYEATNARTKFVVGWLGKGTKDLWSVGEDVKGIQLVRALETRFKSHPTIELFVHDTEVADLIPHNEIVSSFYQKIDCLLCTSTLEGTPNPVFEAWASGVFVLSTRVGNVGDIMLEGINGLYIERDVEHIAKAIEFASGIQRNRAMIKQSVKSFDWALRSLSWVYALNDLESK